MRECYEKPMMYMEAFVPNEAVSACTVNSEFKYTFDCMRGPNVDKMTGVINNTIATGCSTQVGYASGYTKARNYNMQAGHSNNNATSVASTWITTSLYVQVTYTGNNIDGLLYMSGDSRSVNTNHWEDKEGYWSHTNNNDGQHVMIAPVVNVTSINASW